MTPLVRHPPTGNYAIHEIHPYQVQNYAYAVYFQHYKMQLWVQSKHALLNNNRSMPEPTQRDKLNKFVRLDSEISLFFQAKKQA